MTTERSVGQTRERVEAERAKLAHIEAEQAAAHAELESLEQRSGAELLDSLDRVDDIAATMGRLSARVGMLGRAIVAQRPRVMVAESRYLAAEADAAEPTVAQIEAELAEHDAETRRLLAALEKHECPYVTQAAYVQALADFNPASTGMSWQEPKSTPLRAAALLARRRVTVLRELAAGRDPEPLIRSWDVHPSQVYPDCVRGADALVPTPAYLRSVEYARQRVLALEAATEAISAEIVSLEHEADVLGVSRTSTPEHDPRAPITRRKKRLADLPSELALAREHLAALEPIA